MSDTIDYERTIETIGHIVHEALQPVAENPFYSALCDHILSLLECVIFMIVKSYRCLCSNGYESDNSGKKLPPDITFKQYQSQHPQTHRGNFHDWNLSSNLFPSHK